jgi:hypothetical protein
MLPVEGVIHMDSHIKESSVRLLIELRDAYRGQLDTSVIEEINTVVAALEQEGERSKCLAALDWGDRVLELIGKVIRVVTNITDLMS